MRFKTITCIVYIFSFPLPAVFSSIGLIVFGAKVESWLSEAVMRVSWSFGLEIVAVILTTLGGVFAAFELMSLGSIYRRPSPIKKKVKNIDIPTISVVGDVVPEGTTDGIVLKETPYNTGYDQKEEQNAANGTSTTKTTTTTTKIETKVATEAATVAATAVATTLPSTTTTTAPSVDTNPFSPYYQESTGDNAVATITVTATSSSVK